MAPGPGMGRMAVLGALLALGCMVSTADLVLLDATNGTRARRDEWQDGRWDVSCKVFDEVDAETCRARAIADGREYLLPVIDRMAAAWEWPDPDWESVAW